MLSANHSGNKLNIADLRTEASVCGRESAERDQASDARWTEKSKINGWRIPIEVPTTRRKTQFSDISEKIGHIFS
jgi:hypothetical protein